MSSLDLFGLGLGFFVGWCAHAVRCSWRASRMYDELAERSRSGEHITAFSFMDAMDRHRVTR